MKSSLATKASSIRAKLIIFSLCLLIIPSVVIGSFSYLTANEEINQLVENKLQDTVKMTIQMSEILNTMVEANAMDLTMAEEMLKQILIGPVVDSTRTLDNQFDLGKNGYFFIIDNEGNLIGHPEMEGANVWDSRTTDGFAYIQDMIQKANDGGGFTYYDWPLPGADTEALKVSYSESFPQWNWNISAGSYMRDYNDAQVQILKALVWTIIICTVLGMVLVWFFARHVSNPLQAISQYVNQLAQGNLTQSNLMIKNKDELGQLAGDVNAMVNHLTQLIKQILTSANQVHDTSEQLSISIQESSVAVQEISNTITNVASGMETQAKSTEETARAMEHMTEGIQQVADHASEAFESSTASLTLVVQGNETMTESELQMRKVEGSVQSLSEVMIALGRRTEEIGMIASTIGEISSQTHLLALNASIEAARAGEHGSGFAVVASEIRKLAQEVQQSSDQVTGLIDAIKFDMSEAEKALRSNQQDVRDGVSQIHQAFIIFQHIRESIERMVSQIEGSSAAAEQMTATSEQIATSLQEVASISSETSDHTQSVSASTEETAAIMQEMTSSAIRMKDRADMLHKAANYFKV